MNKPDRITSDLEYYLGRVPTPDTVAEAMEWQEDNPESNLAEWVDAMKEAELL